ncbi:MAG TPA: hypothetical protein VLK22_04445 [Candidatus Udaeobacter sp.]|nr:hypothetical protein [Candidatus Udaeobacter sp.]
MLVILNKLNSYFSKFWLLLKPRRRLGLVSFVILTSLLLVVWFVSTSTAQAGVIDGIRDLFTSLIFLVAGLFIKLTFFLLKFVIEIAGYNSFIDSSAVIVGWVMVRDITNMFFVVILLLISFGTILGLEQYEYKKLLVKLLIAAIVVNFSRIICGIIIDIAQVVMITFVNGIAATAGGNLVSMFGVDKIFKLTGSAQGIAQQGSTFLAAVAAIGFSSIMMMTMLTFLFLLLARMVALWILIVLSPFAFVLNVLPQTQKYAGQWWDEFGGNVVAGPIVAFFLWLAFVTVGNGRINNEISAGSSQPLTQEGAENSPETSTGITDIMSWAQMANFAIAIGMLLTGAKVAQQLGAAGGSLMSKAGDFGKRVAMVASGLTAARWAGGKALAAGKATGKFALMKAPLIGGEAWQRRGRRIRAEASGRYYDWVGKRTIKAGKIAKQLAVNEKGKYIIKGTAENSTPELDKNGKPILDEHGEIKYKDIKQSGPMDWFRRMKARAQLAVGPGFSTYNDEYLTDMETTVKYKKERLEHMVSTSSLRVGLEKRKAEEMLHGYEETGKEIKSGRTARMQARRQEINEIIENGVDVDSKLRKKGLNSNEIFEAKEFYQRTRKAESGKATAKVTSEETNAIKNLKEAEVLEGYMASKGAAQESRTAALKAETKQIDDKLNAEREIKELEAIRELIREGGFGHEKQKDITASKAMLEQITFDINQDKDLALAIARDQYLKAQYRDSEALNEQNVLAKQAKERIEKQSVGTDYPRSKARVASLLNQKNDAFAELEAAKLAGDSDKIKIATKKFEQSEKSLSEMQIGNWEQHGSIGAGNMAEVVSKIDPELLKGVSIDPADTKSVRKVQAAIFTSLTGDKVDASGAGVNAAVEKFNKMHGARSQAMLEQLRLALDKAAGQGVFSVAGVLQTELGSDGRISTKVADVDNADEKIRDRVVSYIKSRREAARSAAKITTISAGLDGTVDINSEGKAVVESPESIKIITNLLSPLTSTRLDSVDEYVRSGLAGILKNSTDKALAELKNSLSQQGVARDKGALATLLSDALRKAGDDIKKENKELIENWIKEFGPSVKAKKTK